MNIGMSGRPRRGAAVRLLAVLCVTVGRSAGAVLTNVSCPRDCSELPPSAATGLHNICPKMTSNTSSPVEAYCDMDTDGGKWTALQRRGADLPRQDFYLNWTDYSQGFGNLSEQFWMGLEYLHQLTDGRPQELRVELGAFDNDTAYAIYHDFQIASEDDGYAISATFDLGTAGNGITVSGLRPAGNTITNVSFSTPDRDQDTLPGGDCVKLYHGPWWHCSESSLNGRDPASIDARYPHTSIWWYPYRKYTALKTSEMKIRPMTNSTRLRDV